MNQENTTNLPRSTPPYIFIIIGLLVLMLALQGYFMFFKSKAVVPKPVTSNETKKGIDDQLKLQKITELERKTREAQGELITTVEAYKEKTGKDPLGGSPMNLSPEQSELIKARIEKEKDVSLKSFLQEILEKNKKIEELAAKIAEIENKLPLPHIAKEGETHVQIAIDFLVNQKRLDKKLAQKLVDNTLLMEPLKAGFKVWNFYLEGVFLSSVTQGKALISPNNLIRVEKGLLVEARKNAESQRDQLALDIKSLEKQKAEITMEMERLNRERVSLTSLISKLNEKVNSLFYMVDSEKNLLKQGILKGGFLKSIKFSCPSADYFSKTIDLRSQTYIPISASDWGMQQIKKVTLYPQLYKEGTIYTVEISSDRQTATLTLLDTEEFKTKQVVIAVK